MNVRRLVLSGFAAYEQAVEVDLPERGLVVCTGPNGAGKSSLLEAVATAIWNRSLRGPAMWIEGAQGRVLLDSDVVSVDRRRSPKGRNNLGWQMRDPADLAAARLAGEPLGEDDEYESATKAQARLERVVGSFDVWRRTSVLSSADAAHFALATDAERKALLEQVLGLDRFDAALAACRSDLREAEASAARLDRDAEVARASLDAAREASQRADEVLRSLPEPEDPDALFERLERLTAAELAAAEARRGARRRLDDLTDEGAELRAGLRQAEAEVERHRAGACPRCGQDVRHLHAAAERGLGEARARVEGQLADLEARKVAAASETEELTEELDGLRRARADVEARRSAGRREADARRAALSAAEQAAARLEEWQGRHAAAVDALARRADDRVDLEACERALGLRGVRATMLDRALVAVQQQANAWLARLAFPGSLRLSSTTEQKSGRVVDAISVEVEGAGGGKYRGCSAGQRRRVDLAVLFGLLEVAQAARGGRQGTLWVDEAADSLDAEGRAAFADAMADLARARCVVVITHDAEMAARLPATLRLHVEAGVVVRG